MSAVSTESGYHMSNTISDARSAAWATAWSCLETAGKLRIESAQQRDSVDHARMTEQYDGLLREATIFAKLATAAMDVGITAGAWLNNKTDEVERRSEKMDRMAMKDFLANREGKPDGQA